MPKSELNRTGLKKYLAQCSKKELEHDLNDLFTKFEVVRNYFQSKLNVTDNLRLLEKYKEIVNNEFFPRRGFGRARLAIARKAITDYKKVCTSADQLADLMLFYVEAGVNFTNTYGDITTAFYSSLETMYAQAVQLIVKHGMRDLFQKRCAQIMQQTSGIGWGFHDAICDIYEEHFEEE